MEYYRVMAELENEFEGYQSLTGGEEDSDLAQGSPNKLMTYVEVAAAIAAMSSLALLMAKGGDSKGKGADPEVLKQNRRVEQKIIHDARDMDRSMKTLGVPAENHAGTNLHHI